MSHMPKIIFINPPQRKVSNDTKSDELEWIPLGLCYLAAVAEKEGYTAKTLDLARDSLHHVEEVLKIEKPDFLGISCWTDTRMSTIEVARLAKKINPNIKIIIGGSHATFFPEHMFKLAPIDVVVLGEGEETLKELLKAYTNNKSFSKIKGIAYKQKNKIIKTQTRPLITNLDEIPFPIYNGLDIKRYRGDDKFSRAKDAINGMMISSRGCPYQCTFCSTCLYWERKWRARSAKNTVDEMEHIYNKYGINNIRFWDDHFTLNKARAIEICKEIIKRKLHKKITWGTSLRVDCLNEETINWMKKAGCNKLIFGVESGSPTILHNIKKGFTVKNIEDAFDLCHKHKMYANASIMVGNPGENEKTVDETIKVLKKIKPDNPIRGGSILIVFPGTEIYTAMKNKGKINDNFWLTDKPMPYYSLDHNFEELIMLSNRLTFGLMSKTERIKYVFVKGIKTFFKNPKVIFKLSIFYIKKIFKK